MTSSAGAGEGTRTPTVARQNLNLVRLPIPPHPLDASDPGVEQGRSSATIRQPVLRIHKAARQINGPQAGAHARPLAGPQAAKTLTGPPIALTNSSAAPSRYRVRPASGSDTCAALRLLGWTGGRLAGRSGARADGRTGGYAGGSTVDGARSLPVGKNVFHLNPLGTQHDSGRFGLNSDPGQHHNVVSLHYPLRPGSPSVRLHAKQSLSLPRGLRINTKPLVSIPPSGAISAICLLPLSGWWAPKAWHPDCAGRYPGVSGVSYGVTPRPRWCRWWVKTISTLILWGPGTIVDVSNLTRTPADTIRWFRCVIRSAPAPRPPAYMKNSHYHGPKARE